MQDAAPLLETLGLKRNEGRIYLCCLRAPRGLFVHEIVRETGVKRSSVNVILARLVERQFIHTVREGNRRKFLAQPPESLIFTLEKNLSDLRKVLPALLLLQNRKDEARVRFFQGACGLRQIYDDMLLAASLLPVGARTLYAISSGTEIMKVLPDIQRQFVDRRVKDRIRVNMIAARRPAHATWPSDKKACRETRYYDSSKYPFQIELTVYGNKVAFLSPFRPVSGVIIENRAMAGSLLSLHKMLWDMLEA